METIHGLNIHGAAIVATGVVFTVLTVVAVGLRFTSKRLTSAGFGLDDWLILAALLIYVTAEILVIRSDIVGRKATSPEDHRYLLYQQYVYIYSCFYWPIAGLVQISILLLYRHLFYPTHLRYTTLVLAAICVCWCIAASIIEIFYAGHPISYFFPKSLKFHWNVTYLSFWLAMSIIETLLEIVILVLPLREVSRLKLSTRKKYLLSLLFGMGGLVIITGIIRMANLYRPGEEDFDLTLGDIWLNVHLGTAILSACLPTLRPLKSHGTGFLRSFHSRRGSYEPEHTSKLSAVRNRMRESRGTTRLASKEGIVLQPQDENQGSFADARWSEGSNTPSTEWQEGGPVKSGEAIGVRRTVEVV